MFSEGRTASVPVYCCGECPNFLSAKNEEGGDLLFLCTLVAFPNYRPVPDECELPDFCPLPKIEEKPDA